MDLASYTTSSIQQILKFADSKSVISALGKLRRIGSCVRAQIVTAEGSLVDDFLIVEAPNAINVLNAPSPAATASIAIGRHIAGLASKSFNLDRVG